MLRSLVGSEMCIRDSARTVVQQGGGYKRSASIHAHSTRYTNQFRHKRNTLECSRAAGFINRLHTVTQELPNKSMRDSHGQPSIFECGEGIAHARLAHTPTPPLAMTPPEGGESTPEEGMGASRCRRHLTVGTSLFTVLRRSPIEAIMHMPHNSLSKPLSPLLLTLQWHPLAVSIPLR